MDDEQGVAELGRPEFPVVERGYDRAAVDEFVAGAREIVARLAARSSRADVQRSLEMLGRDTAAVLQRAHEVADDVMARARAEAEEIRRDAQAEAEAMVARARARVVELEREIEVLRYRRLRTLEDVRRVAGDLERVAAEVDRVADQAEERMVEALEEDREPGSDRVPPVEPPPAGRPPASVTTLGPKPPFKARMHSVPPPPAREADGPASGRSVGHRLRSAWRHGRREEGGGANGPEPDDAA